MIEVLCNRKTKLNQDFFIANSYAKRIVSKIIEDDVIIDPDQLKTTIREILKNLQQFNTDLSKLHDEITILTNSKSNSTTLFGIYHQASDKQKDFLIREGEVIHETEKEIIIRAKLEGNKMEAERYFLETYGKKLTIK